MPTHRRETIMVALKSALEAINGSPTYNHERVIVERLTTAIPERRKLSRQPYIFLQEPREEKSPEAHPNIYRSNFFVAAVAILTHWENRDTAVADMVYDIEKAIAQDHTLGGVALDVRTTGNSVQMEGREPLLLVVVEMLIQYQHALDDPSGIT